ncbi:MAG: EamA family transporter [Gammaproteobacteria bacterium]|nr:EamA family transporter [Gammaproteobacteria bacterium]
MPRARIFILTTLTLMAFAGNSLLCRAALRDTQIDAASFTLIRLLAGALVLWLVVQLRRTKATGNGSWLSALSLFTYAATFSFAYISLPAATGALLLFGAVQVTMIGHGLWRGERLLRLEFIGIVVAFAGLVGLLLPGLSAPPLVGSMLMLAAGIAWGVYSLRGKSEGNPMQVTAGNFMRAVPIAIILSVITLQHTVLDKAGVGYAIASGAITSGLGYTIWYMVLPSLKATSAATMQLTVPVIAAVGGILLLGEAMTLRLVLSAIAILGGIALVNYEKQHTGINKPRE